MLDQWGKDYKTRKWAKYEFFLGSAEAPPLEPDITLDACRSDSERAKHIKDKPDRFYWDNELVAADLDPVWGGGLSQLVKEWRGHPAGKLVMVVCTGCNKNPTTFTYAVEID